MRNLLRICKRKIKDADFHILKGMSSKIKEYSQKNKSIMKRK